MRGGERVVVLSGGVGGARLAAGLAEIVPPDRLTIVVNTADDFEPYGLHVAPDVDTVLYTLAGRVNEATGWGVRGDSGNAMRTLGELGDDAWFFLGDQDLAVHLLRTGWLADGVSATEATARLALAQDVRCTVLPMTDDRVRTWIGTSEGELAFQEWFVGRRCSPPARAVSYRGAHTASPSAAVVHALDSADVIVVGPSNPYLSIGPMLALPGMVELLVACPRVVAVSPVIDGAAVKGPAAAMLRDLAGEATPTAVARLYQPFVNGLALDAADNAAAGTIAALGVMPYVTDILMRDAADRARLGGELLAFARGLEVDRVVGTGA